MSEFDLREPDLLFADQVIGFGKSLAAHASNPGAILQVRALVRQTELVGQVHFVIPQAPLERRGFVVEIARGPGGYHATAVGGKLFKDLKGQTFSSLDWLLQKIRSEIAWLIERHAEAQK